MRDRDRKHRIDRIEAATRQLAELVDRGRQRMPRLEAAVRNLDDWVQEGRPARSQMVSDVHQARGVQDPTAANVLGQLRVRRDPDGTEHVTWVTDTFEADRALVDELVEQAYLALRKAAAIAVRHTETPIDRSDPTCELCEDLGWSIRVFADQRCQWHYDFRRTWGVDAHAELGRHHHEQPRRYITEQLVRRHHPDARRRSDGVAATGS